MGEKLTAFLIFAVFFAFMGWKLFKKVKTWLDSEKDWIDTHLRKK